MVNETFNLCNRNCTSVWTGIWNTYDQNLAEIYGEPVGCWYFWRVKSWATFEVLQCCPEVTINWIHLEPKVWTTLLVMPFQKSYYYSYQWDIKRFAFLLLWILFWRFQLSGNSRLILFKMNLDSLTSVRRNIISFQDKLEYFKYKSPQIQSETSSTKQVKFV